MWKSLILPHQDYCSILWSPVSHKGDKLQQEGPLRSFTKRAWGISGQNYWDRLRTFRLTSMERRVERYKVLYLYKIENGLVPNCGLDLYDGPDTRSGDSFTTGSLRSNSESIKTKLRDSLKYNGVRIYNAIPRYIRDIKNDLPEFKKKLDTFLNKIPDQPSIPGLSPGAKCLYGNESNSIIDWIRLLNL